MNESEEASVPAPLPPKIFDRLFQSRTVLIHGEVDSRLAQAVTAQLLALAAAGDDPITVFIHSEGGHVEAGDSIHDIVRFVKPRVRMIQRYVRLRRKARDPSTILARRILDPTMKTKKTTTKAAAWAQAF